MISRATSPRRSRCRCRASFPRRKTGCPARAGTFSPGTGWRAGHTLTQGGLRLDPTYRAAPLDDATLGLTTIEFDLLHAFMRQPGRPFTCDELLTVIQASGDAPDTAYERTIDAHIKNLRHKLGGAGRHSRFIETIHGVGYRFSP